MVKERSPTVVVLGAAGFVGRHVCRELARQDHHVVGLGHGRWFDEEWRKWGLADWVETDITLEALQRLHLQEPIRAIVHCAGSGAVAYSYSRPFEDFQRATVTTAATLEWVRLTQTKDCRVVIVSSAAVYGDQGDSDATENSVKSPISPYGFTSSRLRVFAIRTAGFLMSRRALCDSSRFMAMGFASNYCGTRSASSSAACTSSSGLGMNCETGFMWKTQPGFCVLLRW